MRGNEYQELAIRTEVSTNSDNERLLNASIGMSVESAEVLQHIQRFLFCGKGLSPDKIMDECGDVLWYLSCVLSVLGYSLEDCMKNNIAKTESRYPDRISLKSE